jgi:hypothetical protein
MLLRGPSVAGVVEDDGARHLKLAAHDHRVGGFVVDGDEAQHAVGLRTDVGLHVVLRLVADHVDDDRVVPVVVRHLGQKAVAGVDAHAQQQAPAGVFVGLVEHVDAVGGAGGVRRVALAEVQALVVDDVAVHLYLGVLSGMVGRRQQAETGQGHGRAHEEVHCAGGWARVVGEGVRTRGCVQGGSQCVGGEKSR